MTSRNEQFMSREGVLVEKHDCQTLAGMEALFGKFIDDRNRLDFQYYTSKGDEGSIAQIRQLFLEVDTAHPRKIIAGSIEDPPLGVQYWKELEPWLREEIAKLRAEFDAFTEQSREMSKNDPNYIAGKIRQDEVRQIVHLLSTMISGIMALG